MVTGEHPTGSDRIAEVARAHPACQDAAIIVNIQGDEPLIDPKTITQVIEVLVNSDAPMATVVTPLEGEEQLHTHSIVKCVRDEKGRALYFSRAPLVGALRHIGIYAFRSDFLQTYTKLPATPLQLAENLEQLKVLELGFPIYTTLVNERGIGVDTPNDIAKVEACLKQQNSSSLAAESAPL